MILKIVCTLTILTALVASLYLAVERRSRGVLDTGKAQQVPKMQSAKSIRDYRQ